MSHLVPLYQKQTDKNGKIKLDSKGRSKLHPKAGQRKAEKDLTEQELADRARSIAFDESARKRAAQQTLEPIAEAERILKS